MTFTVEQQNQWMEDELRRLRTKRLLKSISAEELAMSVSPETLLAALPAETRRILEQQVQKKSTETKRKPQGRSKSAVAPRRERKR